MHYLLKKITNQGELPNIKLKYNRIIVRGYYMYRYLKKNIERWAFSYADDKSATVVYMQS